MPQLAGREYGKKSGPARLARDLCFGVHEERGFLPMCPQKAEHCLSELQRRARAVAISSDPRDGHKMLTLLLQLPRILCASTGHYRHPLPGSLCSPPLPGSCDPGTTSLGEHTVHLSLLQRHAGLCCCRIAPHPVMATIPLPPPRLSEQDPPNQPLL